MRYLFTFLFFAQVASAQLGVSPVVNQADTFNKEAIETLREFLRNKNKRHWIESDFKNGLPYADLIGIESGKHGSNFYKPTLMELIQTENPSVKIAKISFAGQNPNDGSIMVKAIYNLMVNHIDGKIRLSRYMDFVTRHWKTEKHRNITYHFSPLRQPNPNDIKRQLEDIERLSQIFGMSDFPIDYYSCVSPKEVFELKGFEYHQMMYVDTSGGFALEGDTILSGNNSEFYTHEIAHLYALRKFPKLDAFWSEGLATYLGGSGKFDYGWHKQKLKKFLTENPDFKISAHTDPYERLYFEKETPILYVAAAALCERILRLKGKPKLFDILTIQNLQDGFKVAGFGDGNVDEILRQECELK